jgi:hypothetical protein
LFLRDCYELRNVASTEYHLAGTGLAIRFSPILYVQRLSDNKFAIDAGIKGCLHLRDIDGLIKGLPQFRSAFEEVAEVENVEKALDDLADSFRQWLVERVFSQKNEPSLCTQWEVKRDVVYKELSLSGIKQPERVGEDMEHNLRDTVDRSILVGLIRDKIRSIEEKVDDALERASESEEDLFSEASAGEIDEKFIRFSFVEEMAYEFLIGYLKKSFAHFDGFVKMLSHEFMRRVIYKHELMVFLFVKWLKTT